MSYIIYIYIYINTLYVCVYIYTMIYLYPSISSIFHAYVLPKLLHGSAAWQRMNLQTPGTEILFCCASSSFSLVNVVLAIGLWTF